MYYELIMFLIDVRFLTHIGDGPID